MGAKYRLRFSFGCGSGYPAATVRAELGEKFEVADGFFELHEGS